MNRTKNKFTLFCTFIIYIMSLSSCSLEKKDDQQEQQSRLTFEELDTGEYSDELRSHLEVRAEQLAILLKKSTITKQVLDSNKNKKILHKKNSKFRSLLYNKCALELKKFQAKHPIFIEILVTDINGINVCQTNVINNNFNQINEKWWEDSYNHGKGKLIFGKIEYDHEFYETIVPIYIPIYFNSNLIGIGKASIAILDIERIDIY